MWPFLGLVVAHLSQKSKKGWKVCNRDLKMHRSCTQICVDERGECFPRSYIKGDHDFPVVIIGSPFCSVAYPFFPSRRPSTRTRTRKWFIIRYLMLCRCVDILDRLAAEV